MKQLLVAKVGGSLFDLPDLQVRLQLFIADFPDERILLVPGGGEGADVIRKLDRLHGIGIEKSHWLALRVLSLNAHFLADLLRVPVVTFPTEYTVAVIDPFAFCHQDDASPWRLEHSWQVTSDSVAARVAEVGGGRVALLKSADLPQPIDWRAAGHAGLVDTSLAGIIERGQLSVTWINLRRAEFADSR